MSVEIPVPTEGEEQKTLFCWADMQAERYPELSMMYHIPNGGGRNKKEAANLKAEGVKPGVPDICLPVPCGKYHGLYIEMKRTKGGRLSDEQRKWLIALGARGYKSVMCEGWIDARETIIKYLEAGSEHNDGDSNNDKRAGY